MSTIIVPRSLLLRGLPYQKRPQGWRWQGVSGARTTADPDHGLPMAKDRLIFLELATLATRQGQKIHRRPRDIAARFQLSWTDAQVIEAIHRVALGWYEPPTQDTCCGQHCHHLTRRVPVAEHVSLCGNNGRLTILLSDYFFQDAQSGAPADPDIIARLASKNQLGALDIYLVTAWERHHNPGTDIPLMQNGTLFGMLPSAKNADRTLQQARERFTTVLQADSENAYRFSRQEGCLVWDPQTSTVIEPRQEAAATAPARKRPGGLPFHISSPPIKPATEEQSLQEVRRTRGMITNLPWPYLIG